LSASIVETNGQKYLVVTVTRSAPAPNLNYTLDVSSDMRTWASGPSETLTETPTQLVLRDNTPLQDVTRASSGCESRPNNTDVTLKGSVSGQSPQKLRNHRCGQVLPGKFKGLRIVGFEQAEKLIECLDSAIHCIATCLDQGGQPAKWRFSAE